MNMKINNDKIIGFTSILVSFSTLIILVYEINLTRKQQYASVLPYMSFLSYGMNSNKYFFRIKNDGLGPGFITEVKIIKNKEVYDEDPYEYLLRLKLPYYKEVMKENITYSNIFQGMIIPAGEHVDIFQAFTKQSADSLIKIIYDTEILIQVKYKSIYDEEWLVTQEMTIPEKIK